MAIVILIGAVLGLGLGLLLRNGEKAVKQVRQEWLTCSCGASDMASYTEMGEHRDVSPGHYVAWYGGRRQTPWSAESVGGRRNGIACGRRLPSTVRIPMIRRLVTRGRRAPGNGDATAQGAGSQ
jgi:hypothetical protein